MENTVLHVLGFMDVLLFFQGCVKDHRLWVNSSKDEPPYPLIGEPTRTWPNLVLTLKLLLKPLWICTAGINFFFFLLDSTKYKSSCLFPSSQDTLRKEVSQSVGSHSWGHWCANISTKRFTSGSVSAQLVFCHQGVSVKLSYCNLFCSVVEASNSKWLSFKIPPESPTSWLIAAKHEFAPNFCQISSPTTRLYRGFASNAPVLQMSEPWFFPLTQATSSPSASRWATFEMAGAVPPAWEGGRAGIWPVPQTVKGCCCWTSVSHPTPSVSSFSNPTSLSWGWRHLLVRTFGQTVVFHDIKSRPVSWGCTWAATWVFFFFFFFCLKSTVHIFHNQRQLCRNTAVC